MKMGFNQQITEGLPEMEIEIYYYVEMTDWKTIDLWEIQ